MLLSLWAFALGVYGVAFWPALPAAPWLALTLPALLCLARPPLRPVAALVLGCAYGWAWGLMQLDHRLALEQDKTDYRVTGVVRGLPDHDQRRVRFLFDVDTIESLAGGPTPDLSRLRIS